MSTTNFKIFDEGMLNLMSDADYADAIQRLRGVVPGLAIPTLHNKLFLQTSIMCKALADFIVAQGYDALDTDVSVLLTALQNAIVKIAQDNVISGKNMWTESAEVSVGDVMYTADGNGPRWAYLLCSIAGTTGLTEPVVASNVVVGQTIVDNDVTWTVKSVVVSYATQAEAETGTDNVAVMTSLRVIQSILSKIATAIQAQAGTLDDVLITPAGLRSGLNAAGSAPVFACRAWVNFDGSTATPTIGAGGNVSSITDVGVGQYRVNFTTPMADNKYAVNVNGQIEEFPTNNDSKFVHAFPTSASYCSVAAIDDGNNAYYDCPNVSVTIHK